MTVHHPINAPPTTPAVTGFVSRADEDMVVRLLLRPFFTGGRESMLLAGFDQYGRLVQLGEVAGTRRDRCEVPSPRWRALVAQRAVTGVMMAHNHPSGDPRPSARDIEFTRETARHLDFLAMELNDHLIFVSDGHFSFARAGLL